MPTRMTRFAVPLLRRSAHWRQFHAVRRNGCSLSSQMNALSQRSAVCGLRGFASQSASAVASIDDSAIRADSKRHATLNPVDVAAPADIPVDLLHMLEKSIAERQPSQALAYYQCLETPPSGLTSQKLAILLAKQESLHQTRRAFEILQAVYGAPEFSVDDYTQLASIYVVDACLRHKMTTEALEIFDRAHSLDISLDLPAYDRLVQTLVESDEIDKAREILTNIMAKKQVVLQQHTFQALLVKMMTLAQYDGVVEVIDNGRKNGVQFTFETYDPLVEMGEEVDDSEDEALWDQLERFMSYINEALEEDGLTGLSDDDDDDDGIHVEVDYDDDDDDDDDDEFDDDKY